MPSGLKSETHLAPAFSGFNAAQRSRMVASTFLFPSLVKIFLQGFELLRVFS